MINMQNVRLLKGLKHKHGALNGEPVEKKFRRLLALKTPQISLEQRQFNVSWADWFQEEAKALSAVSYLFSGDIQHIGSTSISGMPSKNIIDMAVTIEQAPESETIQTALTNAGYENYGNSPMGKSCLWYWKVEPERCFVLHVAEKGDEAFEEAYLFRDYLRQHPEKRTEYQAFKFEALQKYPDLFAYSVRKMDIYCDLLACAKEWKASVSNNANK